MSLPLALNGTCLHQGLPMPLKNQSTTGRVTTTSARTEHTMASAAKMARRLGERRRR
jgi:hypothetical protein